MLQSPALHYNDAHMKFITLNRASAFPLI
jgi:hypothetical protein